VGRETGKKNLERISATPQHCTVGPTRDAVTRWSLWADKAAVLGFEPRTLFGGVTAIFEMLLFANRGGARER
jgi:hypothetical protein